MWKVIKSDEPIAEHQLASLEAEGWELRLCVPWKESLYWYFIQPS